MSKNASKTKSRTKSTPRGVAGKSPARAEAPRVAWQGPATARRGTTAATNASGTAIGAPDRGNGAEGAPTARGAGTRKSRAGQLAKKAPVPAGHADEVPGATAADGQGSVPGPSDGAEGARRSARGGDASDPRLPPVGTKLIKRDRHGRVRAECEVVDGGFRYDGKTYTSLSAAASAAAVSLGGQKSVNGWVFFGLAKPARPMKDEAAWLRKVAARYEERAATLLKRSDDLAASADLKRELERHAASLAEILAHAAA